MKHFLDCHIKGIHSLSVGTTEDGKLIRMFIAESHHTLWQNSPTNFRKGIQSLAFHNYKSDITIIPLTGIIQNITLQPKERDQDNFVFAEFIYRSKIVDDKEGCFEGTSNAFVIGIARRRLEQPLFLKANTLHTIHVAKNKTASWLIIEGDPEVEGAEYLSYSASDLSEWSPEGLYRVPTAEQVAELKKMYLYGANHGKA